MRFILTLALSLFAAPVMAQPVQTDARPRAVVELFTSQGCSSCPPADRLMGELAKDPSLIILTLPVDYWDYLGWKDTLAHASFTARQRGYGWMRGDRQVYTPQAVINGVSHAVGSERAAIDKAIRETRKQAQVLSADVRIAPATDGFQVSISSDAGMGQSGHVWLMPIASARDVQIGRGENTGRSITYVNVVRGMVRLGVWTGEPSTFAVQSASLPADADGMAILVQEGSDKKPFRILGAARWMRPGS